MLLEGGVKVFGDCAIMENPTTEQLASIAQASAKTAKAFGIDPRIAMLSYATGDSNTGPMITKVTLTWARNRDGCRKRGRLRREG
jgi:phosphate acetyltransferase